MRVAVLTDVHGNQQAFEAVLSDLEGRVADAVILGGDIALFGANPRECWEGVRALGWRTVQGNTDRYIADLAGKLAALGPDQAEFAEYLRQNVAWARAQLGDMLADALGELAASVRVDSTAGSLLVVHGVPGNDEGGLARDDSDDALAAKLGQNEAAVVVCGHTHTAFVRHVGEALVVNCGSVGRSHDRQPGQATYAVLDDSSGRWSAAIRRVPYNHQAAHRAVRERGVPLTEDFAATLLTAGAAP